MRKKSLIRSRQMSLDACPICEIVKRRRSGDSYKATSLALLASGRFLRGFSGLAEGSTDGRLQWPVNKRNSCPPLSGRAFVLLFDERRVHLETLQH